MLVLMVVGNMEQVFKLIVGDLDFRKVAGADIIHHSPHLDFTLFQRKQRTRVTFQCKNGSNNIELGQFLGTCRGVVFCNCSKLNVGCTNVSDRVEP